MKAIHYDAEGDILSVTYLIRQVGTSPSKSTNHRYSLTPTNTFDGFFTTQRGSREVASSQSITGNFHTGYVANGHSKLADELVF